MEFDIRQFQISRFDSQNYEADLLAILSEYQSKYFGDVKQKVLCASFSKEVAGPGCVKTGGSCPIIEVNECLRHFVKFCCLVILHELINNKLFELHGEVIQYDDPRFEQAVRELWIAGAYEGLL